MKPWRWDRKMITTERSKVITVKVDPIAKPNAEGKDPGVGG